MGLSLTKMVVDMGLQWREIQGKQLHDPFILNMTGPRTKYCPGPIIVGAGPSGLAVAACLKEKGISSTVIERASCIASLWQHRTYDRLRLHLPKSFCELPLMPFPEDFPTYPSKQQFLSYLEAYAKEFEIKPMYNQTVESAAFDAGIGMWRVRAKEGAAERRREYVSRWLVVATGENAEAVVPEIEGMEEFEGRKMHTSSYRRGDAFAGKKVLVVGCGNSGMEICLDLCNHNARPTMVVRDSVGVLFCFYFIFFIFIFILFSTFLVLCSYNSLSFAVVL